MLTDGTRLFVGYWEDGDGNLHRLAPTLAPNPISAYTQYRTDHLWADEADPNDYPAWVHGGYRVALVVDYARWLLNAEDSAGLHSARKHVETELYHLNSFDTAVWGEESRKTRALLAEIVEFQHAEIAAA